MFSIKTLVRTVQDWRRRRRTTKPSKRAVVTLECLDHRQLLSANFTGNAIIDIPATTQPGTVLLANNLDPNTRHSQIPPDLLPLIKVSGLDINGIRLRYTPGDDTLSVAIQQPDNQKTGQPVLAGDTDNNGDGGTVSPAVQALRPAFLDFPYIGGSETMGVFLNFHDNNIPDVVAGIPNTPGAGKLYQVNKAVVNPDPTIANRVAPTFGDKLLTNTGASFLTNDPLHPAFEFQITNFSQLYMAETGHALTTTSTIGFGAFGNSLDDDGISETFFPAQSAVFGVIPPVPPVCPPPVPCPPLEPPILINPHEHRHVNTAHPTDVRVNILGAARFDVNKIVAGTVRLGGAAPIASFDRHINNDPYEDRTFIFRGSDITLPRGITDATVTGNLTDGTTFQSTYQVFNKNDTFYTPQEVAERNARQAAKGFSATNPPLTPFQQGKAGNIHDLAIEQAHDSQAVPFESAARATVKIATRPAAAKTMRQVVVTAEPHTQAQAAPRVGTAAADHAGSVNPADSPLLVSIPLRPVTQHEASTTVRIPRRIVIPEVNANPTTRTRPLVSIPTRSGWARAGSA